jgi:outer membrane receptor protein involved in Fe transport
MLRVRHINVLMSAVLTLAAVLLVPSARLTAQVTTATVYGTVNDTTGAVLPTAKVTFTNQGTNLSRQITTDARGEFAIPALPGGRYTVKIELANFKTYLNQSLELNAGQTVRQGFVMEVGQVTQNVTVVETAPLVETASAAQLESLGTQEVGQLPLARRNLVSLMTLSTGVTSASTGLAGGGNIRLNGVAEGGTAVTVDGTDAVANQETRGTNSYGGQNQISVMSIEAVAEVQVVKGVLPAEYGGVTGGQVNMISRSGTNQFHGSLFENLQNDKLFARDPFLPVSQGKPAVRFNQFGGSLGGPVLKDRVFFFGTYEGYRETYGVSINDTVPTQQTRDQILQALPFPETKLALDPLPLPNEPINAQIGRFRIAKPRTRHDNTALAKGDVRVFGGNLSLTFSRMRPFTQNPSIYIGFGNDQKFVTEQDRVATQYVRASASWISETRFGWNRNQLNRVQDFWFAIDPTYSGEEEGITTVGHRIPLFSVSGLFTTPSAEILQLRGRSYNFEQKVSRVMGQHNVKLGFRFARQAGSKTNPQNPIFNFNSLADLLANIPNQGDWEFGIPPHDAHLDEYGGFVQDDWRVNKNLVLNLGLRYDYYPTFQVHGTTGRTAQIVNLEAPTDLDKLDFGAPRPADKPYNPDGNNFGPRVGFAWSLGNNARTVIRGGVGVLFSDLMFSTIQNTVSDPYVPAAVIWNKTDLAQRGIKWPVYGADLETLVRQESGDKQAIYSLINPNIRAPFTVQSMFSVEQVIGGTWMVEAGYVRTDGRDFPLHHAFSQAFDRATGVRPNQAVLGTPTGYYISSEQTMVYNALQLSVRKRLSSGLGFDFHYTLSKGWADQGGGLSSSFVNSDIFATQDFFHPFLDRAPISQEARHLVTANVIYELPWLKGGKSFASRVAGGWRVSSIFSGRTGVPLRLSQPSGVRFSRPDLIGDPILSNSRDSLVYLNKAAFQPVPTSPVTGATLRAGTQNPGDVRGPGFWTVDLSLGKTFSITESAQLELRGDAFNSFNHVNFNNPVTTLTSPSFGRFTSAATPRTIQIAARFAF